jgi:phytoene synthase
MNMIVSQVATYVASSDCQAIADDALKDEDNGLWLMAVPASMHQSWFQRFQWIRWLDRLAEQDQIVQAGGVEFAAFRAAWQQLATTGQLPTQTDHSGMAGGAWPILEDLHRTWFADGKPGDHPLEMAGWQEYVDAIARYHRPHFTLETLADYEAMLDHLAGACFQFLPDLTPEQRAIARPFGMVDQCYNILRDLYEDARQGICYFPQEVLQEFGVTVAEILNFTCFDNPGYRPLMAFWLQDYLPQLRRRTAPFLQSAPMHPTWQALILWFIHRYHRIEAVMAACDDNFVTFASRHWAQVAGELQHQRQLGCANLQAWQQRFYHPQALADFVGLPQGQFHFHAEADDGLMAARSNDGGHRIESRVVGEH